MIIDNKQTKKKRFLEKIITLIGWIYVVALFFQILLTILVWIFGINIGYFYLLSNNAELTVNTVLISLVTGIFSFVIMFLWSKYNYVNFGKVYRRTKPKNETTIEDISNYFNISKNDVYKMQNSKYVEIETNIL